MLNIRLFKALNGDSIVISYGKRKTYHILIDGGCGKLCYRQLCNLPFPFLSSSIKLHS